MKFDLLEPFHKYLQEELKPNTAKTYYAAVVKLFKDKQFNSLKEIDKEWLLEETKKKFRTRNEYSAVKNGLKHLTKIYPELKLPTEVEFHNVSVKKRNYSKRPPKTIYLKPTQRKINQIRNERLRFAYRLALISGLRVSELADLEASDLTFKDNKIFVRVQKGKGGHGGIVECSPDPYLSNKLPEFIKGYPEGKIFYSESYMIENAEKLGIECHDLRRIFAIQTRQELKKEMPVKKANEIVQQRLRHSRFSTTKRYLFNRKLKFEYEKEDNNNDKAVEKKVLCNVESIEKENGFINGIKDITKINKDLYEAIAPDIVSNEVILTENRKKHIIEGRGSDFYKKYSPYFKLVIDNQDYIFRDKNPNTAIVVKKIIEDKKYLNIVLRIAIEKDGDRNKNSIITAIGMGETRFKQLLKKMTIENKIIYKKG